MSDLNDSLTLRSLDAATTQWSGTSRDHIRRTGPVVSLQIDRATWERMGRPVDLGMTLEATTEPDEVLEAAGVVVTQVYEERLEQIERGYTPEHDDEHGLEHILDQARGRLLPQQLRTREELVQAAACLVAAIEWLDRATDQARQYPDDAEPTA